MPFTVLYLAVFFLLGLGFYTSFKRKKISLVPATFLLLFLNVGLIGYLLITYWFIVEHPHLIWRLLFLLGVMPYLLVTVFGSYVLILTLIINTRTLFKKENKSLAHALPLILALALLFYGIADRLVDGAEFPDYVQIWFYALLMVPAYYLSKFLTFIVANFLLLSVKPKMNIDYIIIHGSGLINGNVTPLLAGRIDVAINHFKLQEQFRQPPMLIMSGGQGADEPRPEAVAMAEYATSKGIDASHLLLESKSTTTLENLLFSKEMMDKKSGASNYNAIYATSDYHVFRTGLYALKSGLSIGGIGSKTTRYYLPNALIREFIAYTVIFKCRQLYMVLFLFGITFIGSVILYSAT